MVGIRDIGHVTRAVFKQTAQFVNKTLSICGDKCSTMDVVNVLNKHLVSYRFKDNQVGT